MEFGQQMTANGLRTFMLLAGMTAFFMGIGYLLGGPAGAMLALAREPEQWARVRADRSLLPGIVEEAIRWTTPVQHFMRTAAEDTEVGGQPIAKGDWLMMNYVAANHDPAHFENPRRFAAARRGMPAAG